VKLLGKEISIFFFVYSQKRRVDHFTRKGFEKEAHKKAMKVNNNENYVKNSSEISR
jgi:hypothetical protein